jgi:hypothetical protein
MDVRPARAAHWDVGETLADRFRAHAGDSQHLYGYAMRGMADDWESGGPIRMASRGYETAPRGALGHSWHFGPSDSKIQFADAIRGPVHPESFEIVARAGCDLNPVDATTADGRLLLTSFVWPFNLDRHKRLAAAMEIASSAPYRHRRPTRRPRHPCEMRIPSKSDASSSDTPSRPAARGTSVSC